MENTTRNITEPIEALLEEQEKIAYNEWVKTLMSRSRKEEAGP